MKKFALIVLIVILSAGYFTAQTYANKVADEKVSEAIVNANRTADVSYSAVNVDLLRADLRIENLSVSDKRQGFGIKIKELIVHDADTESEIPEYLTLSANGVELPLQQFTGLRQLLRDLDYPENPLINLKLDYSYNPELKQLTVKQFNASMVDAGSMNLNWSLGALTLDKDKLYQLMFTFPKILLEKATLSYTDHSLATRLMQQQATQKQLSIEAYKAEVLNALKLKIQDASNAHAKTLFSSVQRFIKQPGEITISVQPQQAVALGTVLKRINQPEFIDSLNLVIEN